LLALLLAAVLVPASADVVISVDDISGARALLEKAGTHAPSIAPESLGATLRERVGVDLFAEPPAWGLAARGARALAFSHDGVGLIAPVKDAAAAKRMLASWIAQKPGRAGRVAGARLFTASGRGASALLAGMARPTAIPRALAARAKGPLWLWARLRDPLRGVVFSLDASEAGLNGRGLAIASGPILAGPAPAGAEPNLISVRAGPGPAGRAALAQLLDVLGAPPQPALAKATRVEERILDVDVHAISGLGSLSRALLIVPLFDGPEGTGAALEARFDLAKLDAALATLTPLDALRGGLAASSLAAHLLYGRLLRNAGPLTLTGTPDGPSAADLDFRLPLR